MPKKSKKGGKGKKGKKGKDGKKSGKKGGKKGGKDRDSELSMAVANSQLWAARLDLTEKSRDEYRENCKRVAMENEKLQDSLFQSERDTIEVVTFLKKGDMDKDEQIVQLEQSLREQKKQNRQEKEGLINEFSGQIAQLETSLEQRTGEVKLMQSELKLVKEFRRKRAAMQAELDEIRENLFYANREHKDSMQKMEHKFFEEKIRLEREASQKIAELAERAHTEAVANLDETTRSVYKENIRLNEALSYHIKESQTLRTRCEDLTTEVEQLRAHKELNDATVKEKVTESKRNKNEIRQLREKVEQLETALSTMVHEFHDEKRMIESRALLETAASQDELKKFQRMLEIKDKETNKVKKLAKNIVEQRTTLEIFFHDALEKVRDEIKLNRSQYIHAAQAAYQRKMMAAHAGQAEFPNVRTFRRNERSTNSVFGDLAEADNWSSLGGQVDVRDLTWEQKEKVLRLLFAKMNGAKTKAVPAPPPPLSVKFDSKTEVTAVSEDEAGVQSSTFITQQTEEPKTTTTLPAIAT